jgi:hypothetical protein
LALAIRVFLDGSGKEDSHEVITVAGFLADEDICEEIERDWETATGKRGFHLKHFGRKACKLGSHSWSSTDRSDFLKRLGKIVNRDGCRIISASLEIAPYSKFISESPNAHVNGPAFSACAQAGIAGAEFTLKTENRHLQKVEYVFEKGDREHELHKMVSEWNEAEGELNDLRGLSFLPKSTTLLEAADLIAGVIERCVVSAHQALPCLENGFSRTPLHNFERHYSGDGVTASVVSGHDRKHCWIINPKTFTVLDRISTEFFEGHPEILEKRLKQSPFKVKTGL